MYAVYLVLSNTYLPLYDRYRVGRYRVGPYRVTRVKACNHTTQRTAKRTLRTWDFESPTQKHPAKKQPPLKIGPSTARFAQIRPSLPYTYPKATLELPWNKYSFLKRSRVTCHLQIDLPCIVASSAALL